MPTSFPPERRFYPRRDLLAEQLVPIELGGENGGLISNLSLAGACVQSVLPMQRSSVIPFTFQAPGSSEFVVGSGILTWVDSSGCSGGLCFITLSPEHRAFLEYWFAGISPDELLPEAGSNRREAAQERPAVTVMRKQTIEISPPAPVLTIEVETEKSCLAGIVSVQSPQHPSQTSLVFRRLFKGNAEQSSQTRSKLPTATAAIAVIGALGVIVLLRGNNTAEPLAAQIVVAVAPASFIPAPQVQEEKQVIAEDTRPVLKPGNDQVVPEKVISREKASNLSNQGKSPRAVSSKSQSQTPISLPDAEATHRPISTDFPSARVQIVEPPHTGIIYPKYPAGAWRAGKRGTVILRGEIDSAGAVSSVEVLEGDPVLAKAAQEALRMWHYQEQQVPAEVVVRFHFINPEAIMFQYER